MMRLSLFILTFCLMTFESCASYGRVKSINSDKGVATLANDPEDLKLLEESENVSDEGEPKAIIPPAPERVTARKAVLSSPANEPQRPDVWGHASHDDDSEDDDTDEDDADDADTLQAPETSRGTRAPEKWQDLKSKEQALQEKVRNQSINDQKFLSDVKHLKKVRKELEQEEELLFDSGWSSKSLPAFKELTPGAVPTLERLEEKRDYLLNAIKRTSVGAWRRGSDATRNFRKELKEIEAQIALFKLQNASKKSQLRRVSALKEDAQKKPAREEKAPPSPRHNSDNVHASVYNEVMLENRESQHIEMENQEEIGAMMRAMQSSSVREGLWVQPESRQGGRTVDAKRIPARWKHRT